MVRIIKYNRSVSKFNELLNTISSVGGENNQPQYYYNNNYPSGFETLFFIIHYENKLVIRYSKFFQYGLDYGISEDEIKSLIGNMYNKNNYKIV